MHMRFLHPNNKNQFINMPLKAFPIYDHCVMFFVHELSLCDLILINLTIHIYINT